MMLSYADNKNMRLPSALRTRTWPMRSSGDQCFGD